MNGTIFTVLAGIVGVLLVASAIGAGLHYFKKDGPQQATIANLNQRIKAWWVMVLLLGLCVLAGKLFTTVFFAFVSFFALREFWSLAPSARGDHRPLFVSFFILLPLQYYLVATDWYGLFSILIPVYAFLGLAALSTLAGDTRDFLTRNARVTWGLMVCVYSISHAPGLLMLDTGVQPVLLLVYLIVVVQLSDVFQYVFGKLFGRHKLSERISPSKTIEGLVGGGLAAVAVGAALYGMTPFTPLTSAAMSFAIVVSGFFGGFVLSAVKRDLAAKDWGNMIAGHGGVLDRVDSIVFAAPIFFHLVRYFYTV
ncbi:phosphatidate cytidylyltransferase [Oryzicola mucosus]|uniref:Phosphatidate cytidylyltransferase n=1 Tax=Oryzicola mucosus TaxID=2767425 RepID=A0A8J6PYX7_9HYPH|nr:phosphatidate cytidylyltransferase [Oryzicola mucosus]MBD0413660.1 phosphatidate cytidylyltransferase [Oryzicola mucosus]